MSARKRLLVLAPRFPYPVIGGDRLRIYRICKSLSCKFDLVLLSLCETWEELTMPIPNDGVFAEVDRVFHPRWRSYLACLVALPRKTPLQVAYYYNRRFQDRVDYWLPKCDMVLAHLIRTAAYVRHDKAPKVLEMTDAISLNYERVNRLAKVSGFKNFVYAVEQKRLKSYETCIVRDFDLTVLVSEVDKSYLFPSCELKEKVLVCTNGVDSSTLPFSFQRGTSKTLAFIGNMSSVQNLDAAEWFSRSVLPKLREHGEFKFLIVGRIGKVDRKRFNSLPGVYATGAVESIAEAVSGALAGVCPMRLGAGVQNKVLEYMALGLPTVTSSMGHEGLAASIGEDLLIADTPQEFVDAVLRLSEDEALCYALSVAGRAYVERYHDWDVKLAPMVARIGALLA